MESSNKIGRKYHFVDFLVLIGLIGFINIKKVTMTIAAIMAILGFLIIVKNKNEIVLRNYDKLFIFLFLILPFSFLFNMIILGFDTHHLDRPFRLILGIFIFLLISHTGLNTKSVLYGIILCLVYSSILSFYELNILEYERAHGFMAPIPFGNFALLLGLIGITLLIINSEIRNYFKILFVLLIASLSIWTSLASGSRGGWVVLPVLIFILSFALKKINNLHRVFVIVTIVSLMILSYHKVNFIKEKIDLAFQETLLFLKSKNKSDISLGSFGTRLEMWRYGLSKFLESPIIGKGYVRFEEELESDVKNKLTNPELTRHGHLHNDVITILAKQGLVGLFFYLVFYIGFFVYFFRYVRRFDLDWKIRFYAAAGLLTVSGMFLFSLSDSMFGTAAGITNYVFLISIFAGGMSYHIKKCEIRNG